jgi:D-glycerate 3-kinase
MSKKVEFNQYDYDRILFLNDIINGKNFRFLNDNKKFLAELEERNKKGINEKNKRIYELGMGDKNLDVILKNREFFEIFNKYVEKFRPLYGYKVLQEIEFFNENKQNSSGVKNPFKKMIEDLYFVYLPFARFLYKEKYKNSISIYNKYSTHKTLYSSIICGIQAHQGCGKTSLTQIIKYILKNEYELNTEILSIDDLYLTHRELKDLKNKDPRFKYRGPPGTHDLELSIKTLENVKNLKTGFEIPRYNKSAHGGLGDRSDKGEKIFRPIDILLFEGWFLGSDPVEEKELENFQIDREKFEFQKLINLKLHFYQPLWKYCDYWVILKPKKYKYSRKWRAQAEKDNKQGMGYKQMQDFLNYFWLSVPPSIYFPKIENQRNPLLTVTLDKYRNYFI